MPGAKLPRTTVLAVLAALVAPTAARAEEDVSFRHDVMAVLSRSGCNQGACHGNLNGKGGFKLSLRGEDPAFDYAALTRDMLARRTSPQRPADSLLLQKATGRVPHEGGIRFGSDSLEYRLLLRWIAAGCPDDRPGLPALTKLEVEPAEQIRIDPADRVQLRVTGHFADGSRRDLTRLAVYEVTAPGVVNVSPDGEVRRLQTGEVVVLVRYLDQQVPARLAFIPARADFRWEDPPAANEVDRHVFAQLKSLRLTPSPLANDSMFVRRAYLDAIGRLPTPEEAKSFLDDTRSDKRAKLIDALLQRPEFADFWALKWCDLLRNEEKALDRKGIRVFHRWVREQIDAGRPLNEMARDLIAARGSTYASPAANFYRSLRDPYTRAEAVAQVFLGVRVQCAKCHNHPFDRWKQNDYHDFAAFFARVQYRVLENNRRDRLDKHEFDGEQIVYQDRETELNHPRTKEPLRPRFLGTGEPLADPNADRLDALADWVARKDNPFFARAQANRVWLHLMGRGLVDPNDDFRATNPPVNPPLLDALTRDFVAHDFDLRHLVRTILNSRTYQLSSQPSGTNGDDDAHFARALVQPLEAEQLLDAISQVTGSSVKFNGYPLGMRAVQLPAVQLARRGEGRANAGEKFLKVFGKPERLLSCECERSEDTGLLQAFQLITGELLHQMLGDPDNRIGKMLAAGRSDAEIVDTLYLAALSRHPTTQEEAKLVGFVRKAKDRRAALEDVAWGLVNSKEFLLRR